MKVSLLSRLIAFEGYGMHCVELARRLPKLGIDVVIRPIKMMEGFGATIPDDVKALVQRGENDCAIEIILSPPDIAPTPGKRTIYFSMCESTRLSPEAVSNLNKADAVVVPSQWCATVFSANGVNRPIIVIPLGVSEAWSKAPMKARKTQPFNFACAGRMMNGPRRKGIEKIIDCFQRAFPDGRDVRLRVKLFPDCSLPLQHDKRIDVERRYMAEPELVDWMREADVFVNVATGGFELFPLQAMWMEKPVISIDFGGVTEYLNDQNAVVVGHHIVTAQDKWTGLGHWGEPDDAALIDAMRHCEDPRTHFGESIRNAKQTVKHLTWENHAKSLEEVIKGMSVPEVVVPSFSFFHGLGDCCNAATLFMASMERYPDLRVALKTHLHSEFIFKAAGCAIVESASWVHGWDHPSYKADVHTSPVWIDNKAMHNAAIGNDEELWRRLCRTEIRIKVSDYVAAEVARLFFNLKRPITLVHTRGETSQHLKNFGKELEASFYEQAKQLAGTILRLNEMTCLTPEVLYEMINRADLLIGIDSGPLHMARMTDTPALGCWFGTHPSAFAIPSARTLHLVEKNHNRGNEYGSPERYASDLERRAKVFHIKQFDKITADSIISFSRLAKRE